MKRLPVVYAQDPSGQVTWRSLAEYDRTPSFVEQLPAEFPETAVAPPNEAEVSRRGFMGIMGAAMAMAGLAGCRRPEEKILPYARAPEDVIPGVPMFFASAFAFHGTSFGLLVESHEGRPTKIEGLPEHPDSLGATTLYAQASVLDLYDPDRSAFPHERGTKKSWEDGQAYLAGLAAMLKATGGRKLAILTEDHRSPSLAATLESFKKALPEARVVRYEPTTQQNIRDGLRIAFGKALRAVHDTAKAKVIVTFDSDFFHYEGSPIRQARGFVDGRRAESLKEGMNRLYSVESLFTLTGATADHRLRARSREIGGLVASLAVELAKQGVDVGADVLAAAAAVKNDGGEKGAKFIRALALDLAQNKGAALVVVGENQPPMVHAVGALINVALGNVGKTLSYVKDFDDSADGPAAILDLAKAMESKAIETIVILGGNPVFTAPADANFAAALALVPNSVHLGSHLDETGSVCTWHIPRAHYLEAWSDARAEDGTASIVQPLIAPLYGGNSDAELLTTLLGNPKKSYAIVQETWWKERPTDFQKSFRRAIHDGQWAQSAYTKEEVTPKTGEVATALKTLPAAGNALEVTFHPSFHAWDGRFANNGWLQELPDPMNKLTWSNAALMSKATADKLGLKMGQVAQISTGKVNVSVPIAIAPGMADNSVAVFYGQGRSKTGRVGTGIGVNIYPLRTSGGFFMAEGAVSATNEMFKLAQTQEHFSMEGRPIVRETGLTEYRKDPEFARKMVEGPPLESLWHPYEYKSHKWGMTIDLNSCIGCGICMIACQAENNVPIVGPEGVQLTREMHWIRVDRYYNGTPEEPKAVSFPLGCQHCENAPCEQVCPVGATVHSPEGLNEMAYNRCIGTKYCGNNCPYKVRRFNYFNYNSPNGTEMWPGDNYPGPITEQRKMQFNPDVTVRSRGIMEKCTFCVQRINRAKIDAHKEGRDRVKDGEITTACQQACPTRAIQFGDLNDNSAKVRALANLPLSYGLLSELNTQPRVNYLAKIRNPNPELEKA